MGTLGTTDSQSSTDTKPPATRRILKSYTSFEDALRTDRRFAPITKFDGRESCFTALHAVVAITTYPSGPYETDAELRNGTNNTQSHSEPESTISSNPPPEFGSPPTTVLSSALIRQTKAIQQREKERRLRQSRLLLVSLLEVRLISLSTPSLSHILEIYPVIESGRIFVHFTMTLTTEQSCFTLFVNNSLRWVSLNLKISWMSCLAFVPVTSGRLGSWSCRLWQR